MTTTMWRRVVGLLSLGMVAVLLMAGCTTTPSSARHPSSSATTHVAQTCRVTAPTQGGIPAGIAAQQYGSVFNTGNLWVGAWWDDPQALKQASKKMTGGIGGDAKYPYGMKYPTWTVLDGKVTGEGGKPRISVKSLDEHGRGSGEVGGYASSTNPIDSAGMHWWPTVVGFTSHGCWQITETQGDDSLVYVVKI